MHSYITELHLILLRIYNKILIKNIYGRFIKYSSLNQRDDLYGFILKHFEK